MPKPQTSHLMIDAHMIGERETGNETYTLNLIRSLVSQYPQVPYHLLTSHREIVEKRLTLPPAAKLIDIPANPFMRIPFAIPRRVQDYAAQLLHVNYVAPPWVKCPIVVTVHDVSFVLSPQYFSRRDRLLLSILVPFTMRRAAAVIAVSQKTRADIIARYHIPAHKISVTYEGADARFRPMDRQTVREFVRKSYGIEGDFILTVGNLQPRKNLPRLITTYANLKKSPGIHQQLVIVGKALWQESKVYRTVNELGLKKDVIFTGYVPEDHLPILYNAAQFFVFPSLYEGFGLPPLEAMTCGTPVTCSNTGALPEVVADAALTFSPTDTAEMARCILTLASSATARASFSAKGEKRANKFSWSSMARDTMAIYEDVIGHPIEAP